jgi:hypothetical protein
MRSNLNSSALFLDQEYMHTDVLPAFSASCIEALNDEGFFGTTNHYFSSKFREEEICPDEFIEAFIVKASSVLSSNDKSPAHPQNSSYRNVKLDDLRKCLKEAKAEVASKDLHANLIETQKKRLYSAVLANFDVAKKTMVDNLLKKTKGILLRGHEEWIETHLIRSERIHSAAGENDFIVDYRKTLKGQIERLGACMLLLQEVPLPTSSNTSGNPSPPDGIREDASDDRN